MNRYQKIALVVAAVNLLLIVLFPPVDQYSIAATQLPVFAGFHFVFALPPKSQINTSVLWLELIVILINAGIAWLLLREKPPEARTRLGLQNAVLVFTGINLVLAVLFPPFESVFALTRSMLPTFEGFYFVFFQKPSHVIVTSLLYIETAFILANGALLWLLFKPKSGQELAAEQIYAMADAMRKKK